MKITMYELLGMVKDGKASDITTDFMFERKKYNLLAFLDEYTLDINSLNWEIEILEEEKKIPEKLEILQKRIDKAIKYLVSHCVISDEWTEVKPLDFVPTGHISYKSCGKKHTENLLNILTGGDEK